MPERNHPPATTPPADWHEAFAALPLEAPRQDRWPHIAAALPATRRPRRVLPWALAAATACVAALPALQLMREQEPPPEARTPAPATSPPAASGMAAGPGTPATEPPVIAAVAPDTAIAPAPAPAKHHLAAAPAADLAPLQEESARLERLLDTLAATQAGDGMQIALAASLQAEVAGIDEALAGPALDDSARAGLWRQRVETLRELATLAADQRWQALYGGEPGGYALVQVY